jgi:hypothetical protein
MGAKGRFIEPMVGLDVSTDDIDGGSHGIDAAPATEPQ